MSASSTGEDQLKKITDFADKSEDKLLILEDSAPFTFFKRNKIVIGHNKVSIVEKFGFKEEKITSINVDDLLNVEVDLNAFLGTLNLYTRFYEKTPLQMKSLSRKNALLAKQVIQGILVCQKKKIDISKIPRVELIMQLQRIGKA